MHAFLITGPEREKEAKKLIAEFKGRLIEFSLNHIDQVRQMQEMVKFSVSGEDTIYLIKNFDFSSIEAQNAFLKILEEKSENTKFIITANSKESLLQTIVSRCQAIQTFNYKQKTVDPNAKEFISTTAAKKIEILGRIKSRDEALLFLENLLEAIYKNLRKSPDFSRKANEAIYVYSAINANANIHLQLTRLFVNFESMETNN